VIITGTPEVGGLTVIQGLEIVRGCRGMNIVGGDLVEVILPVWLVYGVLIKSQKL
jgi:arginase family enzyme